MDGGCHSSGSGGTPTHSAPERATQKSDSAGPRFPTPIEANAQRGFERWINRACREPFERELVEVREGDVGTQTL
jgi:hypothetical protein